MTRIPKPGESVEAQIPAFLAGLDVAEETGRLSPDFCRIIREVFEAHLALLTRQSQDRAELEKLRDRYADKKVSLAENVRLRDKARAELDRAVEREKALRAGWGQTLRENFPMTAGDADRYIDRALAASPGKGVEREA